MPEVINSSIAGVFSYPNAKSHMKIMPIGEGYKFEAEPTNPYDKNAIALYVQDLSSNGAHWEKCGYIPKVLTARIKAEDIYGIIKGEKFDSITINMK